MPPPRVVRVVQRLQTQQAVVTPSRAKVARVPRVRKVVLDRRHRVPVGRAQAHRVQVGQVQALQVLMHRVPTTQVPTTQVQTARPPMHQAPAAQVQTLLVQAPLRAHPQVHRQALDHPDLPRVLQPLKNLKLSFHSKLNAHALL